MSKHLISTISTAALISVLAFLPALRGQTGLPTSVDDIKVDTWNSRPLHKPAYAGIKPATAPRRDLSGIWDATGDAAGGAAPGVQNTGAHEYPAVLPGNNNPPGGEPDESKIPRHLPYSSLGEATLKAHKPTGMGVRSVPAVLGNDPLNVCDPPGFPRMELNVTINDPKMYTEPWMALNKFPLRLQPRSFDIREMYCVPSETAQYNQDIGDPSVAPESK